MDHELQEATELPDHRTYTSMSLEGEAAVGRIAIWAAWLEQVLGHLCSDLIHGHRGVGEIVTAGMPASQLIQLSRKLLLSGDLALPSDLQSTVVKVLTEAKQALEQRNRILHAQVGGSLTPGTTAFYSRRRNVEGKIEAAIHSPDELDAMGATLHRVMEAVFDCTDAIVDARRGPPLS